METAQAGRPRDVRAFRSEDDKVVEQIGDVGDVAQHQRVAVAELQQDMITDIARKLVQHLLLGQRAWERGLRWGGSVPCVC